MDGVQFFPHKTSAGAKVTLLTYRSVVTRYSTLETTVLDLVLTRIRLTESKVHHSSDLMLQTLWTQLLLLVKTEELTSQTSLLYLIILQTNRQITSDSVLTDLSRRFLVVAV